MYKLLLVTDRDDVKEAFNSIPNLNRLMFDPVIVTKNPEEALLYLKTHGADAVGVALTDGDTSKLDDYLAQERPFLPLMRTDSRGEALRADLSRLRDHLDRVHADFSDDEYNEAMTVSRLQGEMLHKLLENRIASLEELDARLMMLRSPLSRDRACFLFEFSLPEGGQYLETRWHHGFERLDLALRANFFGRIEGRLYFSAALIDPSCLRVIACPKNDLDEEEVDMLSGSVQEQVLGAAEQVKAYMDLELFCTRFTVLKSMDALING